MNVRGPLDFARLGWWFLTGRKRPDPAIRYYTIHREATITAARPQPVQADGEIIGRTKLHAVVEPRAVRVVVPPEETSDTELTPERRRRAERLQAALRRWLGPIGVADTSVAIAIADLPHPPLLNLLMRGLATVMNRGDGWVLWLIGAILAAPERGRRAARDVLPALWLTGFVVEFVLKRVFARERPFNARVPAPVIGHKPGSHSFPSGHSAIAWPENCGERWRGSSPLP